MQYEGNNQPNILIVAKNLDLIRYLSSSLKTLGYRVRVSSCPGEKITTQLEEQHCDILLIDCHDTRIVAAVLEGSYQLLQKQCIPCICISTTMNNDVLQQVKKMPPPVYLINPMSKDSLFVTIELALNNTRSDQERLIYTQKQSDSLWLKWNYSVYKLNYQDITYIEHNTEGIKIHAREEKTYSIQRSIEELTTLLPSSFLRVHPHYIVNLNCVSCIYARHIIINEIDIPLSDSYRSQVMNYIR